MEELSRTKVATKACFELREEPLQSGALVLSFDTEIETKRFDQLKRHISQPVGTNLVEQLALDRSDMLRPQRRSVVTVELSDLSNILADRFVVGSRSIDDGDRPPDVYRLRGTTFR
jgi:hypothetical protein